MILAFRADEQVVAAVERLAAALAVDFPGIASGGARSIAIRRALLAAAAALDVEDGE